MNTRLRQLLRPTDDGGAIHIDQHGRAVIDADQVAALIPTADQWAHRIDRLEHDLARARGLTTEELRAHYTDQETT